MVWLGSDPSRHEVKQGRIFVGPGGTRLLHIWEWACQQIGMDPGVKYIFKTNAALCEWPEGERPKDTRLAFICCRPRLMRELAVVSPNAGVLTMGKWALWALTGSEKGMGKLTGFHFFFNQPRGNKDPDDLRK